MGDTMLNVEQIADEILAREGGFVNDPDDPGGATKFGVTIHTLRRLGLDLTGDGAVDIADVKALTPQDAREIFLRHYFEQPRIALLPDALWPSVFDMYVNAGSNAVRILQRLLREMGFEIGVDGLIGRQTAEAAAQAAHPDPMVLADAYAVARRNYYFRVADRRPASRKFARSRAGGKGGWIKRAEAFMRPEFHLSTAAFEQRVATWD